MGNIGTHELGTRACAPWEYFRENTSAFIIALTDSNDFSPDRGSEEKIQHNHTASIDRLLDSLSITHRDDASIM